MNTPQMTELRIRVTNQTKSDVRRYADSMGISVAAAVNLLLKKGLQVEEGAVLSRAQQHSLKALPAPVREALLGNAYEERS